MKTTKTIGNELKDISKTFKEQIMQMSMSLEELLEDVPHDPNIELTEDEMITKLDYTNEFISISYQNTGKEVFNKINKNTSIFDALPDEKEGLKYILDMINHKTMNAHFIINNVRYICNIYTDDPDDESVVFAISYGTDDDKVYKGSYYMEVYNNVEYIEILKLLIMTKISVLELNELKCEELCNECLDMINTQRKMNVIPSLFSMRDEILKKRKEER